MKKEHTTPTTAPEPFVTCEELAEYLGVSKSWIYQRTTGKQKRPLPSYKISRSLRKFKISEVERWLQKRQEEFAA